MSDFDFFDLSLQPSPQKSAANASTLDDELDAIFGAPGGSKPQPATTANTTAATTTTTTAKPASGVESKKSAESKEDDESSSDCDNSDSEGGEAWGPGLKEAGPVTDGAVFHLKTEESSTTNRRSSDSNSGSSSKSGSDSKKSFKLDLANFPNVRKFLTHPLPRGFVFQGVITRQKAGFLGKWPTFELYTDETMGEFSNKFIMCAKRQPAKTANYHISMDRVNFDPPSKSYIGKLRSNFLGNEHVIYDDGVSPEKEGASEQDTRLELGAIVYGGSVTSTQPRDMTVVLPDPSSDKMGSTNLLSRYNATSTQGLAVLQQLKPRYSEKTKTFNLNFHGRVKIPSVKNFILVNVGPTRICDDMVNQTDEEGEALLFGKINDKDQFHMDVRWPLSPLQAFAICVSAFEST